MFGCFRDVDKREDPRAAGIAAFHFSFWDPGKQTLYQVMKKAGQLH